MTTSPPTPDRTEETDAERDAIARDRIWASGYAAGRAAAMREVRSEAAATIARESLPHNLGPGAQATRRYLLAVLDRSSASEDPIP